MWATCSSGRIEITKTITTGILYNIRIELTKNENMIALKFEISMLHIALATFVVSLSVLGMKRLSIYNDI